MGGSFQFVMGQFTRPGQRFVLHTSIIAAIPVHCLSWLIHRSLRRPWCKIAFKQWFNVVEKLPQPSYVYIYINISVCVCGISPISPIIWDYRDYIWIHNRLLSGMHIQTLFPWQFSMAVLQRLSGLRYCLWPQRKNDTQDALMNMRGFNPPNCRM